MSDELNAVAGAVVSEIAARQAEAYERAEAILVDCQNADRKPTFAEVKFMRSELGWTDKDISANLRRVGHVLQNQAIAGTEADREALEQAAADAAEALKTEGPKLADKIEKLQKQLRGLESEATKLANRRDDVNTALDRLTKLAPPHVADEFNTQKKMLNDTVRHDLQSCETELHHLTLLADPDRWSDEQHWLTMLRDLDGDMVTYAGGSYSLVKPKWPEFQKSMAAEIERLSKQRDELQAEYDKALAEISEPLKQYWR